MGDQYPQAIFYDSKNTLFDWSEVWTEASEKVLEDADSSVSPKEFKRTWHRFLIRAMLHTAFDDYHDFSNDIKESVNDALNYHGVDGNPEAANHMLNSWDEVEPFPDTEEALKQQQEFTDVIIFSNVETRYLQMMVDKFDDFEPDFFGTMETAQAIKPSPRAYRWVLDKMGLTADQVLYCAGPQWDVQGAMAYGMKAAWVNRADRNRPDDRPTQHVPDYEVEDLQELTEILRPE